MPFWAVAKTLPAKSAPTGNTRTRATALDDPIADTRRWIERAVIGLNLCLFAKAVVARGQVRYVLSDATTPEALLEALGEELLHLRDTPASGVDTTLIVHPQVLADFLDYNDFLDDADALVEQLGLDGELQVADRKEVG